MYIRTYIYILYIYCSQHLHGGMLSILTCSPPKDAAPKQNKKQTLESFVLGV